MLNPKTNERELAYIVEVAETKQLEGYDSVHYVRVNGWWCVAPKQLKQGDKAIYFEIDSVLPKEDSRFEFMEKRKYRVKTQKICKVMSQGLVLPLTDFPEFSKLKIGDFVTDKLNVILYEPDDNGNNKNCSKPKTSAFQKAMDRHRKFFNFPPVKFLMRFKLFRIAMIKIFVHKKDKIVWPAWLPKTGSERIQNIPQLLNNGEEYIVTEKVDGCSTSFILNEKDVYFVGSHNVLVYSSKDKDSEKTADGNKYFKTNIWLETGEKYNMNDKLFKIKIENKLKTIAIQGETYGDKVQKRNYSMNHDKRDFVVFHIFFNGQRLPIQQMIQICDKYSLPHVHVFDWKYKLPDSVDKIIEDVDSKQSNIDGKEIEGFVFYSQDGQRNFKCVSPNYLLKYHN